MPISNPIEPSHPSTCIPFAANFESADPAVLQSSQNASQSRSPSSKQKCSRKPVPVITSNDIAFPADNTLQSDEKFPVSSQRKSTPPSFSMLPSSQCVTLSPSQASYSVGRSTFASSAMDLTSAQVSPKLPSSLTRNSSVPVTISHATRSPDTPARSIPVTQTRPSLSSPSPPTPIVPSIPLRHATQHSPAHSLTVVPFSHGSHSIATSPLDRRFPSAKSPADQSPTAVSFATVSDPNLSPWSCTTTPDPNQYSLPLKKLLSKPASPSTYQVGSDAEGADSACHHQRSTSAAESVRFSTVDFDVPSTERAAVLSLQSRSDFQDRSGHDYYHYQRATDYINRDYQSKGRKHSSQASGDQPAWWPSWRQSEKESKSKGTRKDKIPNPPRNVLKRRPSNSLKATEPRSPTPSGSRSLTRSLSASSFLKRAGFSRERPPSVLSPSSPALNLPSQPISSESSAPLPSNVNEMDNHSAHSHVEHAPAECVHGANTNSNVVTSDDTPASSIPTNLLTPKSVSKEHSPIFLHPVPASKGAQRIAGTRLSTISSASGSSAGSKSREKAPLPARSTLETYKREQLGDKSDTPSPSPPLLSPSPKLSLATKSSAEKVADNIPSSKRSSNSGLSYADIKAPVSDVIQNQTSLDGDVKVDIETPLQLSPEIDGVMVTNSVVTHSFTNPIAASTPTPTFSIRSSVSSPQLSYEPRARNRLRKSRHASDQIDAGFRPYYTVVGARSEKVFSVGGPRDSLGEGWGIRTTITTGRPSTSDEIKDRASFSKSLTRKISGKFRRERSVGLGNGKSGAYVTGEGNEEGLFGKSLTRKLSGKFKQDRPARDSHEGFEEKAIIGDNENVSFGRSLSRKLSAKGKRTRQSGENDEMVRGRAMPQGGRAITTVSPLCTPEDIPNQRRSDDRCLPYFYSLKKHAQSETDLAARENLNGKFPRFWRLFGKSRSKSRDPKVQGSKSDDPPPLPALPKHYVTDHRDVYVSPPPRKASYSSKSSPSTPSARPSTATSENAPRFWNRPSSAPSSTSSVEVPPTLNPRINLKRYATTDDTNRTQTQKHEALNATRSSRAMHVEVEPKFKPAIEVERSNSPPIPFFSTVDTINSFRPRPTSSDRSKNSPTSISIPLPASPPARPVRSSQRLKDTEPPRRNSFGDEALYPPVMRPSTRPSPKMTYRELTSGKDDVTAKLTEKEKVDRWVALLEKSDAAGGTLHFGGIDDKLPSDDLRFSRTLSELARDDDD